ncbi:DUF2861 family protein [Vibrio sp. 10N.261.55.A7]|uniref:DUF2861 family protein n=1 Tax=Vibrio sp. 10N.261.55.A7 TaxID=1880851 RepID=UPI000C821E6A|nr:DUF2861 family protein [Vibrio sp. 10N.261.55.A7]PMJ90593.1 hypothetical protein BCU12_11800 [Vibrio sp. 10N.261.55.A7]
MLKFAKWVCVAISFPIAASSVEWFESNTPLTQAHQYLLEDDLDAMFSSIVEVHQQDDSRSTQEHLNKLLLHSLQVDCGKGLDNKRLPEWISSASIRRTNVQSPGRDIHNITVSIEATKDIENIVFKRWVDKPVSTDSEFAVNESQVNDSKKVVYQKRYNLNSRALMGLYRVDVTAVDQETWSSWVVFADSKAKQVVRWQSKDQWAVEKNALLNDNCPLPSLSVALYDYIDGKYNEVWSRSYESDYPTSFNPSNIAPDRYVLAVSMTNQRWQGQVLIEQSQIISKTYDVSLEE